LAITHCPLTGSSLAFDRGPLDDVEFGVSGLLYRSNLIMYDRSTGESLWPQMIRGATCGERDGEALTMHPAMEMTWSSWLEMHPETWVVSEETGFDRNYEVHPYGDYDDIDNNEVSFLTIPLDFRRPMKERVLGVVDDSGGVAYPFLELASVGQLGVVTHSGTTSAQGETVILWDASAKSAMAYSNVIDGAELTLTVVGNQIVDDETGSTWRVDGIAASGPLEGRRLDAVPEAYIAFWFGWAAFETNTTIWEAS